MAQRDDGDRSLRDILLFVSGLGAGGFLTAILFAMAVSGGLVRFTQLVRPLAETMSDYGMGFEVDWSEYWQRAAKTSDARGLAATRERMLELTSDVLRQMPLPDPREGDKKARGDVLVIGGSVQVPGAPLLAGTAALRAGAGRLRVATCRVHATLLGLSIPEALVLGVDESPNGGIAQSAAHDLLPLIDGADAVLIGPGLSDQDAIDALTADIFENTKGAPRFVLDARALQSLGRPDIGIGRHAGRLVLTPHAGEMAGLLGKDRSEIEADPAQYARDAADRFRAVVALKGAQTFVASPAGNACVCREGNVGLATSGSGDVLAGIIAGLLARGTDYFSAACWGVYLHAVAGANLARTIGSLGFLAREISREIPHLMAELER